MFEAGDLIRFNEEFVFSAWIEDGAYLPGHSYLRKFYIPKNTIALIIKIISTKTGKHGFYRFLVFHNGALKKIRSNKKRFKKIN